MNRLNLGTKMPSPSRVYLVATLLLAMSVSATDLVAQRHPSHRDDDHWLSNCRERSSRRRSVFCEQREIGWRSGAGRSLTVDAGPNGGVSVSGWDRDSVHVIVKIQAHGDSEDEARELASHIRIQASGGTVGAEGPGFRRGGSWSVSYQILVPSHTDLTLDTENGPVGVEDVDGVMRLRAVNGPLSLERVAGDVRAHAQNGPLSVVLEGSRWQGAGLDAETQNGPVVLTVPDGYSANLETGTVNGPMSVDFPITLMGRIGGRRITTTLGSGGPTVRVVTTNGPAIVRRN
ncbi:MAG: hypothetical protein Q8Q85_14030 [Gemmatimonadales bacterium]|nr:hypothetical protein [Gemmatimonadales bacterium]